MIRNFEEKDTNQIMQIWLAGNTETHDFIPEDYWLSQFTSVQEQLLQANIHVYEQDSKIQGFAGMTGNYLAGIFVDKKYRSLGIGKALLDHIKTMYPVFSLNVYQQNQRAVKFYSREGLRITEKGVDEAVSETEYMMVWDANYRQNTLTT